MDETEREKIERMTWWQEARFGMFIHWGLYAQSARHEWLKKRERISNKDYQKYFNVFNPDILTQENGLKKQKQQE